MQKITSRINDLRKEISSAKQLQAKLVITASDVKVLQNEMEFIRAMDKSFQAEGTSDHKMGEEQEIIGSALQSTKAELEAAKKELSSLKEEGYKLMDEMDVIREELIRIADGKEKSRITNKNYDSSLESLNIKLHKAMSKVESASMAEKRSAAITSTLSAALQQLQSDIDAARRETELATEETKAVRMETEKKTKSRSQSLKERLQKAMKELKAVKASEAKALEVLQAISESTMSDRSISSLWSNTITISKFEYYYLMKQAKAAQQVAEKKVAAARAWMEALEAENKERSMKDEAAMRDNWALVPVEWKGLSKPKKALVFKKAVKINELKDHPEQEQEEKYVPSHGIKLAIAMPRRSITVGGTSGSSRRLNTRSSSISLSRRRRSFIPTPPPSASKKEGKVIVKFLWGRRGIRSRSVVP